MSDARTAIGFDRLPWLEDEAERPRPARKGPGALIGMAAAAMIAIAGASYWMGANSARQPTYETPPSVQRSTTTALPEAQPAQPEVRQAPQGEVEPAVAPTVSPAPEPEVSVRRPESHRSTSARPARKATRTKPPARPANPPKPKQVGVTGKSASETLWPSRVSTGASGRLVQIGAFGSRQQAKLGWRRMTRAYPAVGKLPAVVVAARNSRGRLFYRFQIGTTSQAHSEVLCQRMQRIDFSCAVVGLPWKTKVER